jgi:hypothetical protein
MLGNILQNLLNNQLQMGWKCDILMRGIFLAISLNRPKMSTQEHFACENVS